MTTPEKAAQDVVNQLVDANIKGILNFTPRRVKAPSTVQVQHIDFGIELQSLLFFMKTIHNYREYILKCNESPKDFCYAF